MASPAPAQVPVRAPGTPTTEQLDRYEDSGTYDKESRPALVVEAIHELQTAGVEPDVWKIEGIDLAADCQKVVIQARSEGRDGVACIFLDRGADEANVLHWLRVAASVRGFDGFAVGRTIWYDALAKFLAGQGSRDDAVQTIVAKYTEIYDAYVGAT